MFCEKCGRKLPDDSQFCEFCGAPIQELKPQRSDTGPCGPNTQGMASGSPPLYPNGQKPTKGKGGRIALIVVIVVLSLALIGTGAFFLIRHFTGDKDEPQVPSAVENHINRDAQTADYAGSYRGRVAFNMSQNSSTENMGSLQSRLEAMQAMNGHSYDVTAELRNNTLIVWSPDAPAADADGILFTIPADQSSVQDGVIRNVKEEQFEDKTLVTEETVYLTDDGGMYLTTSETIRKGDKVLVSSSGNGDMTPTSSTTSPDEENTPPDVTEPDTEPDLDTELDLPIQDDETSDQIPVIQPTVRFNSIPESHELFRNWSTSGVLSGPPSDIEIDINVDIYIEAIMNWHWFVESADEYKSATISLENTDTGEIYGPWPVQCDTEDNGQNRGGWVVFPETVIPAGSYILYDSNVASWSYVPDETRDCGMTIIKGWSTDSPPQDVLFEDLSGVYTYVYVAGPGEELPSPDELPTTGYNARLDLNQYGSGTMTIGDEVSTCVKQGSILHTESADGSKEDFDIRVEQNIIYLTSNDGNVFIFVK